MCCAAAWRGVEDGGKVWGLWGWRKEVESAGVRRVYVDGEEDEETW